MYKSINRLGLGSLTVVWLAAVGKAWCQTGDCTPPVVNFTASAVCLGQPTTLTSTSTGIDSTGVTYSWDVNNDGVADYTGPQAAHVFGASGVVGVRLTVSNGPGCSASTVQFVQVLPWPEVTITSGQGTFLCLGQSTVLQAGGGAVSYSWQGGTLAGTTAGATVSVTAPPVGTYTYTVTATSAQGCTATQSLTLQVAANPALSIQTGNQTVCQGQPATLTAVGGPPGSTYTWLPGDVEGSQLPILPQQTTVYTVTLTTAGGCTASATQLITVAQPPVLTATASPAIVCTGGGSTLTVSSPTPGLVYQWSSGPTGATWAVTPTAPSTTYTVTATVPGAGCTSQTTVQVLQANPQHSVTYPDELCVGQTGNAAVVLIDPATGIPVPPAAGTGIFWSPSNTSGPVLEITGTGVDQVFSVTVIPPSGCTETFTFTVTAITTLGVQILPRRVIPFAPDPAGVFPLHYLCPGGSKTLTAAASTGATYQWLPNGPSTAQFVVTYADAPQTYTVVATLGACTGTAQVRVEPTQSPRINGVLVTDTVVCKGSAITVLLDTDSTTNVRWYRPDGTFNLALDQESFTIQQDRWIVYEAVNPGSICSVRDSVFIRAVEAPVLSAGSYSPCPSEPVQLVQTATDPSVRYRWTPGTGLNNPNIAEPIASPPYASSYTVTATRRNGSNLIPNPDFSDGAMGFTSAYSPEAAVANPGTYTVGSQPAAANPALAPCTDHTSGTGPMLIVNGNTTNNAAVYCTTVPVIPNQLYEVSAWFQTLNTTGVPGRVRVRVNGIELGSNLNLPQPPCQWVDQQVFWNAGPADTLASVCILNKVAVGQGNDFALDDLAMYQVCIGTAVHTLTPQPDTVTYTVALQPEGLQCPGTPRTLRLQQRGTVDTFRVWVSGPAGDTAFTVFPKVVLPQIPQAPDSVYAFTPEPGTTYRLIATTACRTDTTTLSLPTYPALTQVTAAVSSPVVCPGTVVTLSASANISGGLYLWQPGNYVGSTLDVNISQATVYTVSVTDACTSLTATVGITVQTDPPLVVSGGNEQILCEGSPITLRATGALGYVWLPGGATTDTLTVSPTTTTTYTVVGTGSCGTASQSILLVVAPYPVVTAVPAQAIVCLGQPATLQATGADFYRWEPGGAETPSLALPPLTGTVSYTVTGTSNGCSTTAVVSLEPVPLPVVSGTLADTVICAGRRTVLRATGAQTYAVDGRAFPGDTLVLAPAQTTTYTLAGTDGNGCVATTTLTLTVRPAPPVSIAPADTVSCFGAPIELRAAPLPLNPAFALLWQPTNRTGISMLAEPDTTTTYTLTVTDALGCTASATQRITVERPGLRLRPFQQLTCPDTGPSPLVWSAADSLTRFASLEWQQASLPEGPWAVVSRQNLPEYLPNPPASRQTYYRLLATTPAGCQALSEAVSIDRRFATPQARIHTLPAPTYRGAVVLESGDSVRFINRSSDPSTAPFNRLTLEWQGLGEPLPAVDTVVWVAPRLPSADAEVVQTLRLRVTNTAGCTDEDSAVVWVRAGCIPKLPNAFSPNADLRNDTWPASATEALALFGTTTQVQVFDRWGTLTYEYPSDGPAWLGTFRNRPDRPCPEAAYVYVARCFDRENLTLPRAGTVTLIR